MTINETYEEDFEDMVQNGKLDDIFHDGILSPCLEKADKGSIKNAIYGICSLHMQNNDKEKPFHCLYIFGNGMRSFDIEDLTEEEALFLYGKLDRIENPFLRTRIADVLWCSKLLGKNNINAAKIAVKGYYDCINDLLSKKKEFWLQQTSDYIVRVFHLAKSIKGSDEWKALPSKILEYADIDYTRDLEGMQYYFYHLFDIISELNFPNKSTYKPHHEKTLNIIDDLKKHNIRSLWIHKFHEVSIKLGEKLGLNGSEISNLKKALSEYEETRKKEDRDRLIAAVEKAEPIEFGSIDITEYCNYTRSRIQGKSFRDAVLEFSSLFPPLPNKETIREQVSQKMKTSLSMLFPMSCFDEEMKCTAKFSSDEERLEYRMMNDERVQLHCMLVSYAVIVPTLDIIKNEHEFSWHDVRKLLENNLFIPEGHNDTFAKGIYYFLIGEFIGASYLLIPKVELCLRHLLSKQGEPVSIINDDGTEEAEINIGNLLKKCVKKEIFSNDLAWILEIYLCSKPINLRNNIAHGKLSDKEATSMNTCVLCYIVFYLVFRKT